MFRCVAVRNLNGGREVRDHDAATGGNGFQEYRAPRERGHLPRNFGYHRACQLRRGRDQDGLGLRIVFGLRQEVRGHEGRARAVIGENQHFGRTGGHVHGRAFRIGGDLLFGGGHPRVAGAEDLVDLGYGRGAIGQCRDSLGAPHLEDGIDTAQLGRDQHRRVGAALVRRGTQEALRAARQPRGHGQHDDGGGQGCGTCRHIQSHGIDGPDDPARSALRARSPATAATAAGAAWNLCTFAIARSSAVICSAVNCARAAANSCGVTSRLSRRTPSKRSVSASSAASPSRRTWAMRRETSTATSRPSCKSRAGQRREALSRIQVLPIQDAHDLDQHFLDRQYQHGAGAGLLQTLEGFPEHILAAHGVYGDAVGVAFQRNDGG